MRGSGDPIYTLGPGLPPSAGHGHGLAAVAGMRGASFRSSFLASSALGTARCQQPTCCLPLVLPNGTNHLLVPDQEERLWCAVAARIAVRLALVVRTAKKQRLALRFEMSTREFFLERIQPARCPAT